jgi:hypothetical protein
MSAVEVYTKEVHEQTHRYATWLPGDIITLGTVGYLEGKAFQPHTHLKNFGISAEEVKDPAAKADYTFASGGVTEVAGNASASGVPTSVGIGAAKLKINFSSAHSVYVALRGCVGSAFGDLVTLGDKILQLVKTGNWKLDWVVVTRLVTVASATILQAEAKGAAAELEGSISATPVADLLKVGAGVKMVSKSSVGMSIVTEPNLTPLLGLAQVRYTFFDWLFDGEPQFSYIPSRRSIRLAPFSSRVHMAPNIDFASDIEAKGDILLNVRVPQIGEYVDIADLIELTTSVAPGKIPRAATAQTSFGVPARMPRDKFLDLVKKEPYLDLGEMSGGFINFNVTLPKAKGYVRLEPLIELAGKASGLRASTRLATDLSFDELT